MEKNEKIEKKKKFSIGWKRSLSVTLVAALLIGSLSFADSGPKAQAAEYSKIVGLESFDYRSSYSGGTDATQYIAKLDDGSSFILPYYAIADIKVIGKNVKKYRRAGTQEIDSRTTYSVELTHSGELFITEGPNGTPKKVLEGVKDFEMLPSDYSLANASFYALMNDDTVQAWGRGSAGELGIGYKQDKAVPTEVVDPATGDPIENVRKIFQLGKDHAFNRGVLLVTDTEVYLIGRAFGKDSFSGAKPLKLDFFPAFQNADFELKFMENVASAITYVERYYNVDRLSSTERLIFTIQGKEYVMTSLFEEEKNPANNDAVTDLSKSSLIPVPEGIKTSELVRSSAYFISDNSFGTSKVLSTGYTQLNNGVLTYWGTTTPSFGGRYATFEATPRTIATGVKSVSNASIGNFFYLRNNNVYGFGPNAGGRLGVLGGVQESPVRITGTNNEVKNVKELVVGNNGTYALKDDNSVVTWTDSTNFKTFDKKFLTLFEVKKNFTYNKTVFGIGEDRRLYIIDGQRYYELGKGVLPDMVSKDYVAPVTAPDKPILSAKEQDKFNQSVVSINFGSNGDIATKQYQINGGGWLDYTGDILVTQVGKVTIQARSADSKGNISEVGELTLTSDPIIITTGHPKIEKISPDEFKISAEATGSIKVQVKVDGAAWQDFNLANNLLLSSGDHTVEVRLLNDRDQELLNKSFNVTADNPAPVIVGKPSVTQKGLNRQFGLDIEISYDASEGEALYSIDGGQWIATTGSFSVSNAAHTIQAKVVTAAGKESEVTEFITTVAQPKITVNADQVSIDLGINTSDVTVHYKDSNNQWVEYTGPVNFDPGTHNIEIEVRDNTGTPVFNGGPYTVTVTDPKPSNPGDGGTTPPVDPGPATPISDEEVDFTVHSGGLSGRFEGIDLSTIVIDSTNPYQQINSVSNAFIDDSTGRAGGWQYSLQITDFVSEPMYDSSTQEKGLVVSIPTNSFSVNVGSTKTLAGPENQLSNVGKKVFSTEAQVLALANPFEGMGYYQIPLNFTLSVPDRVKVVKSSDGSKYAPGQDTGLMAGVYKSTFTFTLTSGI